MKKKIVIILVVSIICLGGLVSLLMWKQGLEITADKLLAQVERSLDPDIRKQSVSKIAVRYTYTSTKSSAAPIYYYMIITDYYEAYPADITGPNTDAFYTLFIPEDAEYIEKIQIQTWPGCLYILPERAYLCWTVSPEESYIIEYDPKSVLYEDIVRMAESVA